MKLLVALAVPTGLFSIGSPDQGSKANFHVTSVRSEGPRDASCSGCEFKEIRFTVEGYAHLQGNTKAVEYVLECDEIIDVDGHFTAICAHVHANKDYEVRIYDIGISFWGDNKPANPQPTMGLYSIVSEKEVASPKR